MTQPARLENPDLALAVAAGLLLIPVALFSTGPLRVVLGLGCLFAIPGYTLTAALFPRKADLEGVYRFIYSMGLSLALLPLLGIILHFTPWGIRLESFLSLQALLVLALAGLAYHQRRRLGLAEEWSASLQATSSGATKWLVGQPALRRAFMGIVLLAGLGLVATLVAVLITPKLSERFTEVYLLAPTNRLDGYPYRMAPGEQAKVTLTLVNREQQTAGYRLEVRLDGERIQEIGPVLVKDQGRWQQEIVVRPTRPGQRQLYQFLVFRDVSEQPYRSLQLWIDALSPS